MTVYSVVRRSHKTIDELLNRLAEIPHQKTRRQQEIFQILRAELLAHMQAEEETFYEALSGSSTGSLVAEFEKDHDDMRAILDAMEKKTPSDVRWREYLFDLFEAFEEHATGEEDMLFKKANRVLTREEVEALGERMSERRESLLGEEAAA